MTPKRAFKRWMIQGTGETFRRVRVPRRDYTVFCLEGSSRQALLVGGI